MSAARLPSFHRITKKQWQALVAVNATWGDVKEQFRQPSWCEYPDALDGSMGCWSLVGRMVKNRKYCQNCDLCKKAKP
jgi:hypothetical protein